MRKIPYLLLALTVAFVLVSCEEDEYDSVYVEMTSDVVPTSVTSPDSTTSKLYNIMYGGEAYRLNLIAREMKKGMLNRVTVSTFDRERRQISVLDTTLSTTYFAMQLIYVAPEDLVADTTDISFTVSAYDNAGQSCHHEYHYKLVQKDVPLNSIQGIVMYAVEQDERPNGFSLSRQLPVRTSLSDSTEVSIYASRSESDPDRLALEWRTLNGTYFVKNNAFDFSRATRKSVSAAYRSSVPYHVVGSLAVGDVVIVGNEEAALGIIKLQAVYDDEGSLQDRYIFDYKPLK
ncbi:MAG: hypothetical protein IJ064_01145 [Bacteroidaceae bacterium]|nr:hypothetical protein [Bacteroidaceae bacterium]